MNDSMAVLRDALCTHLTQEEQQLLVIRPACDLLGYEVFLGNKLLIVSYRGMYELAAKKLVQDLRDAPEPYLKRHDVEREVRRVLLGILEGPGGMGRLHASMDDCFQEARGEHAYELTHAMLIRCNQLHADEIKRRLEGLHENA